MRIVSLMMGLVIAGTTQAQGPEITFKSLPFGASQADYLAAFPDHICSSAKICAYERIRACVKKTAGPVEGAVCNARNTWAGLDMLKTMASFDDGKLELVNVAFRPNDYDKVLAAAGERWGPPDDETEENIQTRMGARYVNKLARWTRGGATLLLRKYARTIDEGSAILISKGAADRRLEALKAAPVQGAKDM